ADLEVGGAVGHALTELELPVVVVEEGRGIRGADRRGLRVVVGLLLQQVSGRADEAPVEAPDGLALPLEELVREGVLRDPQVRLLEVLDRESRVLVHLLGHRLALGVAQGVALDERRGVRAERVGAHLGEERLEGRRLTRHHLLVGGDRPYAVYLPAYAAVAAYQK